jgi:hypothetical protein
MYLTVSSWLLISFVIEESRAIMLLNRTRGVVWAPKSPSYPLRGQVGGGWTLEIESFFGSCVPVYIKLPMRLWFLSPCTEWFLMHAIYAPMIYTDSCVMFLIRACPLWEQVGGGLALEISSFLGPRTSLWNGTRLSALCRWLQLAQLAKGKSLGRSKPATSSYARAPQHTVWDDFYYIQALLNCLL